MTGQILGRFKRRIADLKLIPATGGCFELAIDGELVYSKIASGRFPDEAAMLQQVQSRLPNTS